MTGAMRLPVLLAAIAFTAAAAPALGATWPQPARVNAATAVKGASLENLNTGSSYREQQRRQEKNYALKANLILLVQAHKINKVKLIKVDKEVKKACLPCKSALAQIWGGGLRLERSSAVR